MVFLLITDGLDAFYPLVLAHGIDQISAKVPLSELTKTVLFFAALMSILAITRYYWRTFFGHYHSAAAEDLRNRVFHHITNLSPRFFEKNPTGEIMSLMINDVQSFRQAIGHAVLILTDGLIIILLVVPMMIYLNPSWTWKTLILLPILPFAIRWITKNIFKHFAKQQDILAKLSGHAQETISGIRILKSFVQESHRLQMYNEINRDLEHESNQTQKWDALFMPLMMLGVSSGSVILLFIAGPDIFSGVATIGTLVAFQRYIAKIVWPMTALGFGMSQFQKGMASFARIKKLLLEETDVPDTGLQQMSRFEKLKFENVSFQYPSGKQPALEKINFEIQRGQLIGIIGPVGSGKSTLMSLMARLQPLAANQGQITINGQKIEDYSLQSLRSHLTLVPQVNFLFSDTIAENMSLGLPVKAPTPMLETTSEKVDLRNEIEELDFKYESELGERGINLSGGQKQRMTLARAVILNSDVLLLDDNLSAVDMKTEEKILHRLKELQQKGKTLIVVSHRLSALQEADQIIVLNQGRVEAIGSPHALLKTSKTYQHLATLQNEQSEAMK